MAKWDFSIEQYNKIMARLDDLERTNQELRAENAELRRCGSVIASRFPLKDINNADKARELFEIAPSNGKIVKSSESFKRNFQVFYQNIFRALNPKARVNSGNESIVYTPINTLTSEEYQISIEALEAVIDVVYYAKQKLNKEGGKQDAANT